VTNYTKAKRKKKMNRKEIIKKIGWGLTRINSETLAISKNK
jgi:hypothetical protein